MVPCTAQVCIMEIRPKVAWTSLGDDQSIVHKQNTVDTLGEYRCVARC